MGPLSPADPVTPGDPLGDPAIGLVALGPGFGSPGNAIWKSGSDCGLIWIFMSFGVIEILAIGMGSCAGGSMRLTTIGSTNGTSGVARVALFPISE